MEWQYFLGSMLFLAIGYVVGSISFGIIVSITIKKKDVRETGSGNSGATNALRTFGWKIGLPVFLLDVLKPIVAIMIAYSMKEYAHISWLKDSYIQMASLGAVIGHILPMYHNFKGGKGAACMLGFIISFQWILAIIGFVVFMTIVLITRKVSLGSIVTPFVLIIISIIFGAVPVPYMNTWWTNPIMHTYNWWINISYFVSIWLLVVISHRGNIKRLLKGEERSIGKSKA